MSICPDQTSDYLYTITSPVVTCSKLQYNITNVIDLEGQLTGGTENVPIVAISFTSTDSIYGINLTIPYIYNGNNGTASGVIAIINSTYSDLNGAIPPLSVLGLDPTVNSNGFNAGGAALVQVTNQLGNDSYILYIATQYGLWVNGEISLTCANYAIIPNFVDTIDIDILQIGASNGDSYVIAIVDTTNVSMYSYVQLITTFLKQDQSSIQLSTGPLLINAYISVLNDGDGYGDGTTTFDPTGVLIDTEDDQFTIAVNYDPTALTLASASIEFA